MVRQWVSDAKSARVSEVCPVVEGRSELQWGWYRDLFQWEQEGKGAIY
jgi:hypothetical protein